MSRFSIAFFIAIALVVPARASLLWSWSYSGDDITASGTFTTRDSPDAQGGYLITGISGTRNGKTITALQPTGTWIPGNEPYKVDNLIFPGPTPQLTKAGFGFALADGTYSNPFYADFLPTPEYLEFYSMPDSNSSTELPVVFSATLVPIPEPATFSLCVLALAFVYFAFIRLCGRPAH
jgi:hypothetical protein